MSWKIEFYNNDVMESIYKWPNGIRTKFLWITDLIKEFGPADVGMPHIKALGNGLFEIRAKGDEGLGRAFFCSMKGKIVVVLNGFIKKSQKTPPKEMALARKRIKEVKNHE
jgi:phage-related protein